MRIRPTRTPRARGWPAGVVAILLLGALVVVSAVAFAPAVDLRGSVAAGYAAAPGTAQRLRLGDGRFATAEHGMLAGNLIALSVPPSVIRNIRPIGSPGAVRWIREVVSPVPAGGASSSGPQMTLRSVTEAGVSLHAFYGQRRLALEPALLELPADVAAGRQWSSAGRAVDPDGAGDYRNTSTARAGDGGCLIVESTTVLNLRGETRRTDLATWCPGRGVVSGTPTLGEERSQASWEGALQLPAAAPASPPAAGASGAPTVTVGSVDGGPEPWSRAVDRQHPGLMTADGTLFSISQTTGDVAAHRLVDDSLRGYWWGLPAGSVQGLSVVGDTALVTTTERRLVAYASSGVRLWSQRLGDIAPDGAVPIGGQAVAVCTVSGDVEAYDLATGNRLWRAEVPDGATGRGQAIGDTLYVGRKDNAGIAALDIATGEVRWTNDDLAYRQIGFARDGDTLLAAASTGTMLRIDDATGDSLTTAVAGFGRSPSLLLPGTDPAVSALQTNDGVTLLATATDARLAELPRARDVLATDRGWWVLEPDALRLIDPRGRQLTRIPLPAGVPDNARLQLGPDRIWLVGSRATDLQAVWVRP